MYKTVILILTIFANVVFAEQPKLAITSNGESQYSIYIEKKSPKSVHLAARELQEHLEMISGAKLPVVYISESEKLPDDPFISLGDNRLLKAADLDQLQNKPDGFHIVTTNQNVYIWGDDTREDELHPVIGYSMGTLFGTYSLLEDFLEILWIMPGEDGIVYTENKNISLPYMNYEDSPSFQWRRIAYIAGKRKDVQEWELRNRLNNKGYRRSLTHYHAWHKVVPAAMYDKHPEWFAEFNGTRAKPTGDRYKLCTTNQELIDYYADWLIRYFDKHPMQMSYSLSPTDSAGYCQCKECVALDEDSTLLGRPSKTKRILTFYNEVTKRVAKVYPDKMLCGYIYSDFLKPPNDKIELYPALSIVVAPHINYGYQFYRPEVQALWHEIMSEWSSQTENISYYDIFLNTQDRGAPTGFSKRIFKDVFPSLKKYGINGVYLYGNSAWGHSAGFNWLQAKLSWNADRDVDEATSTFLNAAYGSAAPEVANLYNFLEDELSDYYIANKRASYSLSLDQIQKVYVDNIHTFEELYQKASTASMTSAQRERLEMLGENFKILYQNARLLGVLEDTASSFIVTDKEIKTIRKTREGTSVLPPEPQVEIETVPNVLVERYVGNSANEKVRPYRLRGDQHIVFQATSDDVISVKLSRVAARGSLIVYSVVDSIGNKIKSGMIGDDLSFTFPGKEGQIYHLFIKSKSGMFQVNIGNAPWVIDTQNSSGLHLIGKTTTIYFYVPEGVKEFTLDICSAFPRETALAYLYADEKLQTSFTTVDKPVDTQKIDCRGLDGKFWKLDIQETSKKNLDDVFVIFDEKLTGYVSIDPTNLLIVK